MLEVARAGAEAGCREALFTLGDKPELRYRVARDELAELGCETTLEYLARCARLVMDETGLLPHLNPGVMSREDLAALREVSVSMGLMLETGSERLSGRGMPHFGSPDKLPARRLETIALAGELAIPFTTGVLIGIGETRQERLEALEAIAAPGPPVRPRPGGDRPELPRQAGDEDGRPSGAVARRAAVDRRRRAADPAGERPRPVPAEPELRRLPAPPRRRHRRLGRDLPGHRRPREPGSAVAGDRAPPRGDRGCGDDARSPPRRLPRARLRPVDRSPGDAGGPPRLGRRGVRA